MKLKKPRFWDYKKPNIYAYSLYPFSFLINILNLFRLKKKHKKFNIKTICIGNIYLGGTGKTSLCIKINEILTKHKIKSCYIKKFYKDQVDEQTILKNSGKLFLAKERIKALHEAENEKYEVAIFDDGLQDKSIDFDIKIVCFNSISWIGNGMTIPSGPLRENINNLKKYEHVFLNGNLENYPELEKQILKINPNMNIYYGKYRALNLVEFDKDSNYLIFSGIGNHQTFVSMIKNYGLRVLKSIEFPDHYQYSINDLNKILKEANNLNCEIITTEKDFNRIEKFNLSRIKFLKSEIQIINEKKLLKLIL